MCSKRITKLFKTCIDLIWVDIYLWVGRVKIVEGSKKTVQGNDNKINEQKNNVYGVVNDVIGNLNKVCGKFVIVRGDNNIINEEDVKMKLNWEDWS